MMMRNLLPLAGLCILLFGCATSTVPSARNPIKYGPPAEYRDMAGIIVRHADDAADRPDRDVSAKIQLEPTPGAQQVRRNRRVFFGETLTSGPYSNGYVTTDNKVPITHYFRILRDVVCDTTMWVTLVNPEMIRANPAYVSGISRDQDPSYGCEKYFHAQFLKGNDPNLADADGVIIDHSSFRDRGGHSVPFVNQMHVVMSGVAIKFDEPTHEDIVQRLTGRNYWTDYIGTLQLRTVAYWIEKKHATEYRDLLKKALPQDPKNASFLLSWSSGQIQVLRTLASFSDPQDTDLWLMLLRSGVTSATPKSASERYATPGHRNEFPMLAANALACSSVGGDYAEELLRIAMQTDRKAHLTAAVRALVTLKREDLIRKNANFYLESAYQSMFPYDCPFKVTYQ
jgi:hypothetical protein